MTLMGFGIGVAYAVMPALIVERTPRDRTASATGINQVLRLMGGAVGAAGAAAILAAHVPPGRLDPEETGYVLAAVAAVGGGRGGGDRGASCSCRPTGPAPSTRRRRRRSHR